MTTMITGCPSWCDGDHSDSDDVDFPISHWTGWRRAAPRHPVQVAVEVSTRRRNGTVVRRGWDGPKVWVDMEALSPAQARKLATVLVELADVADAAPGGPAC